MRTLRIRNWHRHFENNRTRELKYMAWVPFPVKMDGDGYTELLDHPDGAAHFGFWCACVEVAARCDPRGTLLRDGAGPHNSRSLSRITRIPVKIIDAAIERLISIGWIEVLPQPGQEFMEIPQVPATIPQVPAPESHPSATERNGTERNGILENASAFSCSEPPQAAVSEPSLLTFPTRGKAKTWELTRPTVDSLREAFPDLDILAEARKSLAWIEANPSRRKTARGMPQFLFGWMERAQNRGPPRLTAIGDDPAHQAERIKAKLRNANGNP